MAHLDLNEQEQIAKVKYFWKDWGKYLTALVVVLIIGYAASSIYTWNQERQAKAAATIYEQYTAALNAQDKSKLASITDQLIKEYPGVEYTAMAGLQTAKVNFVAKDYKAAQKYLQWVLTNARDRSLQSIAALRLASVYIDEGDFNKAREMLKTKHDLAFDGLFYEARGDMYIAMGDLGKARDAYREGLQKAANDPTTQQSIQMKLDVIGG